MGGATPGLGALGVAQCMVGPHGSWHSRATIQLQMSLQHGGLAGASCVGLGLPPPCCWVGEWQHSPLALLGGSALGGPRWLDPHDPSSNPLKVAKMKSTGQQRRSLCLWAANGLFVRLVRGPQFLCRVLHSREKYDVIVVLRDYRHYSPIALFSKFVKY